MKGKLKMRITMIVVISFLMISTFVLIFNGMGTYRLVRDESEKAMMNLAARYGHELDLILLERETISESMENYFINEFDIQRALVDTTYEVSFLEEANNYVYNIARQYDSAWIFMEAKEDGTANQVWYYDDDGDGLVDHQPLVSKAMVKDSARAEWYTVPRDEKRPVWTDPYLSNIFEDRDLYFISYSKPIIIEDEFYGITGTDFDFTDFKETFEEIAFTGEEVGIVLNGEMEIIVEPSPEASISLEDLEIPNIVDSIKDDELGIFELNREGHQNLLIAFKKIRNGWTVAIIAGKRTLYKEFYQYLWGNILILLVGVQVAGGFLYTMLSRATGQLEDVTQIVGNIGRGNYDEVIRPEYLEDSSELGELSRSIEKMKCQLKDIFESIKEHNAHLEASVVERSMELSEMREELESSMNSILAVQDKLVEAKKIEAINKLMIEVAHRMNTPLGNVNMSLSYLGDLLESGGSYDDFSEALLITRNGIDAVKEIVEGIQMLPNLLETDEVRMVFVQDYIKKSHADSVVDGELSILTLHTILKTVIDLMYEYSKHYSMFDVDETHIEWTLDKRDTGNVIIYKDASNLSYNQVKDRIFEPFALDSFGTDRGGMELFIVYNLVTIGLNGDIACKDNKGKPYFEIRLSDFEKGI